MPRIPGSDVDRSLQTDSEHFGSSELAAAIAEKCSRLVFCGHIHTGEHGGVDFESTRVYKSPASTNDTKSPTSQHGWRSDGSL